MKIAIISDTHDNLANFLKVINWLNDHRIKLLLHCGDVCSQDTLNEAKKAFKGEIKFSKSNKDFYSENFSKIGEIKVGNKIIAFTHLPAKAKELAKTGNYNLIFYGHNHRPWLEKVKTTFKRWCCLANPGEAAGQINEPTFAVYDTKTDKLELKIIRKI